MYSYEKKSKAIKLYFKYESYTAVINELGYPSRMALRNWVEDHKRYGDVKKILFSQNTQMNRNKWRRLIISNMANVILAPAECWVILVAGS